MHLKWSRFRSEGTPSFSDGYEAEGHDVDVIVDLEDQFGAAPQVRVGEPELFCNPVDKNGEGTKDPEAHLTCYEIEDEEEEERDVLIIVNNQLDVQTLEVEEPELLCVPSEKIDVVVVPEDDDDDDE